METQTQKTTQRRIKELLGSKAFKNYMKAQREMNKYAKQQGFPRGIRQLIEEQRGKD